MADSCPLGKASCDCGGVAWQPDVTCECACHNQPPPEEPPMTTHTTEQTATGAVA